MNIKGLLNKLFGDKVESLILPADLESVPMRDSLEEDKIAKLDEYKEVYEKLLNQNKYFYSHDLALEKDNEEMHMNFLLFGSLVYNHDESYNYYTSISEEPWLRQNVNPRKIELYIYKMGEIFDNNHLKLIALKEIVADEKINLSKNQQKAIKHEISILTNNYMIFYHNVYAALIEVRSYMNELKTSDSIPSYVENVSNDLRNVLIKIYNVKVIKYAKEFIPNKLDEILKMNLDDLDRLAYLERELEIYAYMNLKIDELNSELEEIDKIPKNKDNRSQLLDKITKLEEKYIVLNNYGMHELDLKPLYEVKFDVMTIDMFNIVDNPFANIKGKELKFYEDIIARKIEINIIGADSLLSQDLGENGRYIIPIIIRVLKDHFEGNFDYKQILHDRFLMNLILNMESFEKAKYFFEHYMLNENDVSINGIFEYGGLNEVFIFENNSQVPLKAICKLLYIMTDNVNYFNTDIDYFMDYSKMYDFFVKDYEKDKKDNVVRVPEGVSKINIKFKDEDNDFIDYAFNILIYIDEKKLIMPSTLKELWVSDLVYMHDEFSIPKIVLNEGLEKLTLLEAVDNVIKMKADDYMVIIDSEGYFSKLKTKSLTIPSTLSSIDLIYYYNSNFERKFNLDDLDLTKVPELIFTNCENSIMLHDDEMRQKIINEKCNQSFSDETYMPIVKINDAGEARFDDKNNQIVLVSQDGLNKVAVPIDRIIRNYYCEYSFRNATDFFNCAKDTVISECEKRIKRALKIMPSTYVKKLKK